MIEFSNEDMFSMNLDVLVNTVNCKGVMGKGIAKQFKWRFPSYYIYYRSICRTDLAKPGNVILSSSFDQSMTYAFTGPKYIISFFTKDDWRNPSKLEWIEKGLNALVDFLLTEPILQDKSIGIPALGCGNGGLDWSIVKNLIVEKLKGLDNRIVVFDPIK